MNETKNWFEIKKQFIELYFENPRKADLFAYEQGVKPRTAQLWAFQARKIKEMRKALSEQQATPTEIKPKMINCQTCGAIYSEKLPSCPQCNANKPSEPAPEPCIETHNDLSSEQPSETEKQNIEVIDTDIPLSEIDDLDAVNERLEKLMQKVAKPNEKENDNNEII